ncbi:MAG: HAMP domain-containing histidine kinase [Deltaproteobacteria bacterium]|nr:HAMP domain-containing histidine kinase [Deltaproteobacteria bacterium]
MSFVMRSWRFFQRSIRNKLLIALPCILGFVLLVTFSLSFLFLRQQLQALDTLGQPVTALLTAQATAFVLIACIIIVAVAVTVVAVAHLLSDPLRRFVAEAALVTQTETLQISESLAQREDEVGVLARCMNQLLSTVRTQTKALAAATAQAALGRLARQVAHDLRSPLTTIQTVAAFLRDHRDPDSINQVIEGLGLGCGRLQNIAETLLELQDEVPAKEPCTWFSLDTLCNELVREFQTQPLGVGVEFLSTHESNACVAGDRIGLQRALGNVMKNALEAMQKMGPQRLRQLRLCSYVRQDQIILEVADSGPGIPAEVIPRVLQGGYTAGKDDGHGIGMQVVREVVTARGGTLTCDSSPHHGTIFRLTFPHALAA